jgi:hypothetical protein
LTLLGEVDWGAESRHACPGHPLQDLRCREHQHLHAAHATRDAVQQQRWR